MKLSQFNNNGINKKVIFTNGEFKLIETVVLDGEIDFYDLNNNGVAKKINDNVIQTLNGNEGESEVAYKCFPYLTNIEVDITYEEFILMFSNPSTQFAKVLEIFISSLNDIFEKADSLNRISQKTKELNDKIPNMKEEIYEIKKQEIEKLYDELTQCKNNPSRRKEILIKLQELGE